MSQCSHRAQRASRCHQRGETPRLCKEMVASFVVSAVSERPGWVLVLLYTALCRRHCVVPLGAILARLQHLAPCRV